MLERWKFSSELVSNAVVHAVGRVDEELDVVWDVEPDSVLIKVVDASPDLPRRRSTNDTDTRGRGLSIVAALALDWGVRRTAAGKQVWARVPIVSADRTASRAVDGAPAAPPTG